MGQKKQSGLIGLYSGREIKTAATRSAGLTRTQTGKQALASIVSKYGSIVDNAKYFHIGKGEWRKYSLENDKKRTGSVTTDMNAWRRRPHKLDFQGIDTADGKKGSVKKAKQATSKSVHAKTYTQTSKPKFSLSQLKQGKLSGRKSKSAPKVLIKADISKRKPLFKNKRDFYNNAKVTDFAKIATAPKGKRKSGIEKGRKMTEKKEANRITNADIKRAAKLNALNVERERLLRRIKELEADNFKTLAEISELTNSKAELKRTVKEIDKILKR